MGGRSDSSVAVSPLVRGPTEPTASLLDDTTIETGGDHEGTGFGPPPDHEASYLQLSGTEQDDFGKSSSHRSPMGSIKAGQNSVHSQKDESRDGEFEEEESDREEGSQTEMTVDEEPDVDLTAKTPGWLVIDYQHNSRLHELRWLLRDGTMGLTRERTGRIFIQAPDGSFGQMYSDTFPGKCEIITRELRPETWVLFAELAECFGRSLRHVVRVKARPEIPLIYVRGFKRSPHVNADFWGFELSDGTLQYVLSSKEVFALTGWTTERGVLIDASNWRKADKVNQMPKRVVMSCPEDHPLRRLVERAEDLQDAIDTRNEAKDRRRADRRRGRSDLTGAGE